MPKTTAEERISITRPFIGHTVTVQVKSSSFNDRVITLTGRAHAIAVRLQGTADFRGVQYDLVLDCSDGFTRVFALTRIERIEMEVKP